MLDPECFRTRLSSGPQDMPTSGIPYRSPPADLHHGQSWGAVDPMGPGITRDWFFMSVLRYVRCRCDGVGEPLATLGEFVRR